VAADSLRSGKVLLTHFLDDTTLQKLMDAGIADTGASRSRPRKARTLLLKASVIDACSTVCVLLSPLQITFCNVSQEYLSSVSDVFGLQKDTNTFACQGNVQITPFLKSGWVIGHPNPLSVIASLMCVCVCLCVCACLCACVSVRVCVCACVRVCGCRCVCVCVYACIWKAFVVYFAGFDHECG
jgi:hypothetical protein